MSRMLRGQATLQSIIGKSSITKRPGNVQRSKKGSEASTLASSASAPPTAASSAQEADNQLPEGPPIQRPLPPGLVACPVCSKALKGDDAQINLHLDKCLAKVASSRGKTQSTLAQFTKQGNGHQSKRTKLGPWSSCPDPIAKGEDTGAGQVVSPYTSPERKQPKAAGLTLDALRTRSGKLVSPLKEGTALNFPQESSQEDAEPQALQSPFKSSSQEKPFSVSASPRQPNPAPRRSSKGKIQQSDDVRSAEQTDAAPNRGRGGPASTSSQAAPTRPQSVKFTTQAVGRKFNSSGVAELNQVAVIQHEADNPRDKNALLLVASPPGGILGYLPRHVSHYLGPLAAQNVLGSWALVLKLGGSANSPIEVELEVWPKLEEGDEEVGAVQERLCSAKARAESLNNGALQRSGSGTGEILRSNFLLLLDAVMEQDNHLFSEEEIGVFDAYRAMLDEAQMLFLRLFLRSGSWFKLAGLVYSECTDIVAAAAEIQKAGLAADLQGVPPHERKGAVKCMTSLELQSLLTALKLLPKRRQGKSLTRKQLVRLLHAGLDSPSTQKEEVFQAFSEVVGPCLRLSDSACEAVFRAQRLFFLNESQSLSNFLVMDLGILQYPDYQVHITRPAFPDRAALLAYERALEQAAALDTALEGEDMEEAEAALAPALAAIDAGSHKAGSDPERDFLMRFSAPWVYTSMATLGVSMLEKQKRHADACELLRKLLGGKCCPARRGEWWSRLTINLCTHLKRDEEALETAEAALADEWVKHGDQLDLQRRALRLSQPPRRWKVYPWAKAAKREPQEVRIEAQPLPNVLGIKSKFPCPGGEGECTVEQLALAWYAQDEHGGWLGKHAEGGIWATLFGLLMWDILFMRVPDVFRNQFQTAPLDLPTPAFFPARSAALQAALQRIREGHAADIIRSRWQTSYRTMCAGINWDRHDVDELATIARCIGGNGLAAVCHLLAEDRAGWQGGMPDLLLWNPERSAAKLSEVKGPRDNLSMQQRAWLNALSAAGIDVDVLKVVEPDTRPKKQRGRRR